MRKPIKELTEKEAKEILEFVYPNKTELSNPKRYEYWFEGLSFEPVLSEDGKGQQITFGGRSIIGIRYKGGPNNDGMILHFDDSRVILWLYKNGYDIGQLLENNKDNSLREHDMDNFVTEMYIMVEHNKREKDQKNPRLYTLESAMRNVEDCLERYIFKY